MARGGDLGVQFRDSARRTGQGVDHPGPNRPQSLPYLNVPRHGNHLYQPHRLTAATRAAHGARCSGGRGETVTGTCQAQETP